MLRNIQSLFIIYFITSSSCLARTEKTLQLLDSTNIVFENSDVTRIVSDTFIASVLEKDFLLKKLKLIHTKEGHFTSIYQSNQYL